MSDKHLSQQKLNYGEFISDAIIDDPERYGYVIEVGKLTRRRTLIYYEIQFIRAAIDNVEQSTPKQMIANIKILREKVDMLVDRIESVLVDYGDIDPRHT